MARKKREWYPGAMYHVMSRGNRRGEILKDHNDYLFFMELIGSVKDKYPFNIHSLCLMTNHFHMAIETKDTALGKVMQKLLSVYAEEFNHRHNYCGHLFEGRFTSCLIQDESYFLEVSRYIHLNPVKAQMVREPLDYKYSSYGLFVDSNQVRKRKTDMMIGELVDTGRILSFFGNDSREHYRSFVEEKISHEDQEMLIQKDMKEDDMWLP